jgi:hypothetical protein
LAGSNVIATPVYVNTQSQPASRVLVNTGTERPIFLMVAADVER